MLSTTTTTAVYSIMNFYNTLLQQLLFVSTTNHQRRFCLYEKYIILYLLLALKRTKLLCIVTTEIKLYTVYSINSFNILRRPLPNPEILVGLNNKAPMQKTKNGSIKIKINFSVESYKS
mmetsp:Transcript_21654/g.24167  ORF Transcript_21654/g.24167 Transcript_21654/m.24167 type:complete len:119 (-) Transcript_21654:99-455(-)